MIHYHGTPCSGPRAEAYPFLAGRHALVSFESPDELAAVADACQSFVFDNGAFSVWQRGGTLDVDGYIRWVDDWHRHPGFDWALIPDVINGDEVANDLLLDQWPRNLPGVPVWHMHESLDRLLELASNWRTVAIGSSGQWKSPGTQPWWRRIGAAMDAICDDAGRPICKLHGLRMLDPSIFSQLPLASADSTNAAVNGGNVARFGMYPAPTAALRAAVIADRIEAYNSAPIWTRSAQVELAI
ncbi:TPA: hypothetical protein SH495_000267 [Pseudomonas aeruginosa]|uniref:hypothetical protein n=1 Tax=Pseudomonas aeruginosa TaxID=287 RepID=UPI0008043062|nr:hypothetical protein [Pseudomonas aeruginosa]ANP62352.1 hypothetical protein A9P90_26925 [Pseudomonas aeruginosa]HEH8489605.1 hypothetical protein [Pseudomonas aeruginosa]HEH8495775.1 hypothetical protein [Pseudomonas aeruginosa]HEH8693866.1 hypothetical protein [Pseudomonas aeruginosa]HEH8699946.1 hypothetical protein [Pseudomonas aeruginosa]